MKRLLMISINDRGNLGARILVAQAKRLGAAAFLLNFGEYDTRKYEFSEKAVRYRDHELLLHVMQETCPDIVGISYRSAMARLAGCLAAAVRWAASQYSPDVQIVAGGIGATSDPNEALRWADAVCIGEGDITLPWLIDGGVSPAVDNLLLKDGTKTRRAPLLANLDEAPWPDYDPATTYTIVRGKLIYPDGRLDNDLACYPMLTSRGCPRACSYCHNSTVHELYRGEKYPRQRSVENVIGEIKWACGRWHIERLSIYDDLFVADPAWCLEFARRLPDVFLGRFWCMTHPAYIREDVIRALVGVGLEEVCLGVQTGSERMLKLYRRGTTREQILAACNILAAFPINVKIDIITANPEETLEDVVDTVDLIERMPRRRGWHPGLSRLTIFPGSVIGERITQEECDALDTPRQAFIDGIIRGAFEPQWYGMNLADAVRRYDDFLAWKGFFPWPGNANPLSEEYWKLLTQWLNAGAPARA